MKKSLMEKVETVFNELKTFLVSQKDSFHYREQPNKAALKKSTHKKKQIIISNKSRDKAMTDSQGVPNFSGSSYNGQGAPDNGKIRSNKKRR